MNDGLPEKEPPNPFEAEQRALLHAIDDDPEIWVFGYGSLMWKPGFDYLERRQARLHGWHRSFCVYSEYYRGTREQRGLVLGLDRGGCCQGIAYRLPPSEAHDILDYLWDREMVTWVYEPRVIDTRLDDRRVRSRTFVANRSHYQYAGRLPDAEVVSMIRRGVGITGSNLEYLRNTVAHLDSLGIGDGPLHKLLKVVEEPGQPQRE